MDYRGKDGVSQVEAKPIQIEGRDLFLAKTKDGWYGVVEPKTGLPISNFAKDKNTAIDRGNEAMARNGKNFDEAVSTMDKVRGVTKEDVEYHTKHIESLKKEKDKNKKDYDNEKAKLNVGNIEKLALDAEKEMQSKINERESNKIKSLLEQANKIGNGKPVNERSNQEIGEARKIIKDAMPKPISEMTWEEYKPYGVAMQKQSSHSQPESFYERGAKLEHDFAMKKKK